MSGRIWAFLAAVTLVSGCQLTTPPDTSADRIAEGLVDRTHFSEQDTTYLNGQAYYGHSSYTFHRADGIYTHVRQSRDGSRQLRKGRWHVQTGQVCYRHSDRENCRNVYPEDGGGVRFSYGRILEGDRGGTQSLNGLRPIGGWSASRSGDSLADLLRGVSAAAQAIGESPIGQAIGQACSGGACAAAPGGVQAASSGQTYSCTVACSSSALAATTGIVGDSARDVVASVTAQSEAQARRAAMDARVRICREAGLSAVATIVSPSCSR